MISYVLPIPDGVLLGARQHRDGLRQLRIGGQMPMRCTVDLRSCMVLNVEDGRITEHHGYMDRLEFLSQLGLMRGDGQA